MIDAIDRAAPPRASPSSLVKGRVVELGSHDELMAAGGRYRTMFDLQAERFADPAEVDEEGAAYDVLD